jgi:chloramphenicol 3-O-phosphotransferase
MKHLILVTGPAGVGKTAVAEEWAKRQKDPALHLSLDSMRERVVSGFQHPQEGWNDEANRQYKLAQAACAAVARIYYTNGFNCIIDDAIFPNWPDVSLASWQNALSPLPVELIILTANIEILGKRNEERTSTRRFLSLDQLQIIAGQMDGWRLICPDRIIDTSSMTIDEVINKINHILSS